MKISPYNLCYIKSFRNLQDFYTNFQYDLYISAYTDEDIVKETYNKINATEKIWLIFPEYHLETSHISGELFHFSSTNENTKEADYINEMYKCYIANNFTKNICIDTTGFNKPYLIYLIILLKEKGIEQITFLYTEPQRYKEGNKTTFSQDSMNPRDIVTFDESFTSKGEHDLFIVNVGYDSRLVTNVLNNIRAKIKPLLGFPSLQPIMYQGNILNLIKSKSELGINENENLLYAPANNPFTTAQVISEYIEQHVQIYNEDVKKIYLSPLATKAQTIGMTLFYIFEKDKYQEKNISIHIRYPFTNKYSPSSSEGIFRINLYTIEFDLFNKISK